jgi:hypothetical protein
MNTDPKPQLSPSAIAANIGYWASQMTEHQTKRDQAHAQMVYWQLQLKLITEQEAKQVVA